MHKYIVIHHFGGQYGNPYASTKHLTLKQIDDAHKARWSDFKSELGYYVGYNAIIFPDGKVVQTRKLGEETAATRGFNNTTFNICLAGNFTLKNGVPVDKPTFEQTTALKHLVFGILQNRTTLTIKEGATWNIPLANVVPHRTLSSTSCYGDSLSNDWARNIVKEGYIEMISTIRKLILAIQKLIDTKIALGRSSAPCWDSNERG